MEAIRLVNASLNIVFEEGSFEDASFLKEYYTLSLLNDDPLGMWLKSSKVRKDVEQSDQVILTLLIDLHRKVDALTHMIHHKDVPLHLPLAHHGSLNAIGHGYIQHVGNVLVEGQSYYARIDMPTFPRRFMPIFFEALSPSLGKITQMHEDDEKDWSAYMVACERAMIRQMKGSNGEY